VLVIGDEYLGGSIVEYLGAAQYDVMRLESYGKYDHILKKMQEEKLSLAILTNNTMTPPMLLEFLPKVRSIAKDFPILVLSGCVEPQFVIKMRELGADDFMAMPCDWEDLVSAVKRLTPAV
jgi:DNA-binding response OmpR family regulator